jgi:hypothetical protein
LAIRKPVVANAVSPGDPAPTPSGIALNLALIVLTAVEIVVSTMIPAEALYPLEKVGVAESRL